MTIVLLLFDRMDLLDFGGPYEVFLTASRLAGRADEPAPFEVATVAVGDRAVTAYGGVGLVPSDRAAELDRIDLLVVPGAIAIEEVAADPQVRAAVADLSSRAEVTASVCTGAFLLADAGLLAGRPFTTHWEDVAALVERLGGDAGDRARTAAWVDAGPVVTGGGLSSGISMALHLVDRLAGRDLATATARQLDYRWTPEAADDGSAVAAGS